MTNILVTVDHAVWNLIVFTIFALVDLAAIFASVRAVWSGWVSTQIKVAVAYTFKLLSFCGSIQDDDLRQLLHHRLLETKVNNMRFMMQVTFFAFTPVTLPMIYTMVLGLERQPNLFLIDTVQVCFCLVLVCPVLFPSVVSQKTLDVFYGLLMALCAITPLTLKDEHAPLGVGGTNLITLVLSWVRRTGGRWETLFFIALNLTYAFTTSYRFSDLPQSPAFAVTQFAAVTFITAGAFVLEQDFQRGMLNCMQYQEATEMLAAASALLSSCCEVVVELDAEGVILSQGADLGSFLLRGPSLCLQGSRLEDLLVDAEERRHFSERLVAPKLVDLGLAENMPVSMKDANGTLLRLELMWFQFRRLDGQCYYKVGLREFTDQPQPFERRHAQRNDSTPPSISETPSYNSGPLRDPDPMVVVDSSSPQLHIRTLNAEFASRIGRLPQDASFSAYIIHPTPFIAWLQKEFNEICNITEVEATSCSVTLRMPQGRMKARCRLVRPAEEQIDMVGMESVALRFYSIRRLRGPAEEEDLSPGLQRFGSLKGTPITHVML